MINALSEINLLIERGYVDHESYNKDWILQYREFDVIFLSIADTYNIEQFINDTSLLLSAKNYISNNKEFTIESRIKCLKLACQDIDRWYNPNSFITFMNEGLKNYFGDLWRGTDANAYEPDVYFSVNYMSKSYEINAEEAIPELEIDWMCSNSVFSNNLDNFLVA